jgi:F-type H+-transporting ATPase subunit epsilon|tara:strand:- start:1730 stop:2122 length:393 start_codon:yes stop_codon:yes gene_type:complete
MSEIFKAEIITPDKIILSNEVSEVTIPSFEGLMTILKDHISLVTFLRPGIIEVNLKNSIEKFFIEEGTVEFSNNNLLILTTLAINLKNFAPGEIIEKIKDTEQDISKLNNNDKFNYILSHKLQVLNEIKQ